MKKQTTKDSKLTLEDALFAFRRKLSDSLKAEAVDLKCPLSHIDTLVYIAEKGTPTMKEIATHLNITPPSTTVIIESMQKNKLIKRVATESDRRSVRVELTPNAWKFLKTMHERKFTIFTKMLAKLSEKEKEQFIKIITILIKE